MTKPKLVVIAGPNGSGKTTLTRQLREQGIDFGEYINPDDIAAELTGSYEWRVRAAQKLADERREACIREKCNFSFETVMSHPSKIDIMRRARNAGFDVTLFFVGTDDPRINIDRVRNRVALGGHDVPEDRIVTRYERTMEAFVEAALVCDESYVFDNTIFQSVLEPYVEIWRYYRHHDLFNKKTRRHDTLLDIERAYANASPPRWIKKYILKRLYNKIVNNNIDGIIYIEILLKQK